MVNESMRKNTAEYTSSLDAIIELVKRLKTYEIRHGIDSEDFFDRYSKGSMNDDIEHVEWANDYRHYLALRREVEDQLRHAA